MEGWRQEGSASVGPGAGWGRESKSLRKNIQKVLLKLSNSGEQAAWSAGQRLWPKLEGRQCFPGGHQQH